MATLITTPTRILFFTGKGGVGKTTVACATAIGLADAGALAHIAYPGQGTIIALDPDIPPQNQRIALQLSGAPGPGWQWRVDGRTIGTAAGEVLWRPAPGRHRLSLLDANGQELEVVSNKERELKGKARK